MKKALALTLLLAAPALAAKKPAVVVRHLSGGTLQADGKYLTQGAAFPLGETATLQRGAKLILDSGRAKLLFNGPAVFALQRDDAEESIDLKTGGVLALVASVLDRRFSVRTPAAALAVRGTTFFAETRGSAETYLCLCDGIMDVVSEKLGFRGVVVADHVHTPRLFKMGGAAPAEVKDKMAGHTDAEITELAKLSRASKKK
jgi:hypothetical protein